MWEGGTARLLSLAGGGRTFPWHSAPSWGDSGDVLWKITGAVFEAQGGVWWHFCHCWGWRCCSDKGKQEFLKWWLSQCGFVGVYFNTGTPRIVGCVLAPCSSSLAGGNGSRVTERGRRESQGAQHSSVCAVLCWHCCHIPTLINSSHHSHSRCSHSLLTPDSHKRNPNALFCALGPCEPPARAGWSLSVFL